MYEANLDRWTVRQARLDDGPSIWRMVKDSGRLDVNSSYCYMMLSAFFSETTWVAESNGQLIGFVSSLVKPEEKSVLFVWQIAVDPYYQGRGIAKALLKRLIRRQFNREPIRFIHTTISPSNAASQHVFASLAEDFETELHIEEGFPSDLFPDGAHEPEQFIRIGPIDPDLDIEERRNV